MGYLLILRPLNCLIASLSVVIGAWIGVPKCFDTGLFFAMIIGFCACGFGNIINDIYDMEIDSINAPQRPLPNGAVRKKYAIYEAILFALLSLTFAIILGLKVFILVSTGLLLLLLYAAFLKRTRMANVTVASLTGFSFLLGGLINNNIAVFFPFVFSILIHMPREIIKDLIDETGDRQTGIITCAVRLGSQKARNIAATYLGVLCLLLPSPFILQILTWRYMILIMIAAIPLILYIIIRVVLRPAIADLRSLSRLLKIVMIIGLISMMI